MPSKPPAPDARPAAGASSAAGHALALMVLFASLLLVFLYWRGAHVREMTAAQAEFASRADEASSLIAQRLGNYELLARGGVSLFASVARPSRQQWRTYVEGLNLRQRYPDALGLGFAVEATPLQLSELQRMLRDSGEGLLSVWPHGVRETYGPVLYLEPMTHANAASIGYDLYSDPLRRAAMDAARDSGQPRLTGGVGLTQDRGDPRAGKRGSVLLLPVYRAGDRPASVDARRESLQGWVYVPFRIGDLVSQALRKAPQRLWLRVFDLGGDGAGAGELLYADPQLADAPPSPFRATATVRAYGRRWRLEFVSGPRTSPDTRLHTLRSTLVVGVIASLLLYGIALVLATTRSRADRLAARMTESYRRSEQRFRSAMEYSAIGQALLDRQGRIVDANPALARILGRPVAQILGTEFDGHFLDYSGEDAMRRSQQALLGGGVYRSTRTLLADSGGLRQVQMTFAPVPGEIGQDVVRLVQVEDVTDRLRAEAQVLALNRNLEARVATRTRELTIANQDLESFAYSVSHDLRAPLRAIDGFSRLLGERYGDRMDGEGRDYVVRVRNAASRMGSLIEALLKMARLGRGGIHPVALDVGRMAADIVGELRANEPGRDVEVSIAPNLRAVGDASLVRNLLENLLGNAWKFTRDRHPARIEVGREPGGAFYVRDNGAGFPAEYADKLFRPFQRLHSQEEFAGEGVGLASVRRIVERHGGTIRADSVQGQGATFAFTLPETEPAG
ncbi:MAG: CHASE domain-containing protein [Luteimonas sp.]